MEDHIDWERFSRYLADECSTEERKEIDSWIEADPLRREFVDSIRVIWRAAGRKPVEWDVETAWKSVASRTRIGSLQAPNKSRLIRDKEGLWGLRHWLERSVGQYLRVALALLSMKRLLFFTCLLFFLPSCRSSESDLRSSSHVDKVPENLKIVLGEGGGVTGRWQGYSIEADGSVHRWDGHRAEQNPQKLGKLPERAMGELWSAAKANRLFRDQPRRSPGNLSRMLTIIAGKDTIEQIWVPSFFARRDKKSAVELFFEQCYELLRREGLLL